MNTEDIFDAMTDIDDSIITEAGEYEFKKKKNIIPFIVSAAAAVVIAVALGFMLNGFDEPSLLPGGNETPFQSETTGSGITKNYDSTEPNSSVTLPENEMTSDMSSESSTVISEQPASSENEETTVNTSVVTEPESTTTEHSVENKITIKPELLSASSYPEMAKYPNSVMQFGPLFDAQYEAWRDGIRELSRIDVETDNVKEFSSMLTEKFLTGDDNKNKALSPLNVYTALSILAECTGGNTREQILSLLGVSSLEELRIQAEKLWRKNYRDDGYMKCILANSLWLNNSIRYKNGLLSTVTDNYFASVYYGTTGTSSYDKMLNNWIKEQTGGMLSPDMKMDAETVFTIVSTLLYQTKWADEFEKSHTKDGIFKAPSGNKNCQFMTRENDMTYYWGDTFGAISLGLDIGGQMWFILPDKGYDADSIFGDEDLQLLLSLGSEARSNYSDSKYITVNMEIPKFDISVQTDIMEGLSELGLTDITDPVLSDFSALAENHRGIYVDQVKHGIRVKIDEKGVSAAAYTAIDGAGAAPPPDDRVDFVLDRPFAFAVTLDNETILFAGVVNEP